MGVVLERDDNSWHVSTFSNVMFYGTLTFHAVFEIYVMSTFTSGFKIRKEMDKFDLYIPSVEGKGRSVERTST